MKCIIQIVRLANGHEYYLPTDEEIKSFKDITEVVLQETMTKEEYDLYLEAKKQDEEYRIKIWQRNIK